LIHPPQAFAERQAPPNIMQCLCLATLSQVHLETTPDAFTSGTVKSGMEHSGACHPCNFGRRVAVFSTGRGGSEVLLYNRPPLLLSVHPPLQKAHKNEPLTASDVYAAMENATSMH